MPHLLLPRLKMGFGLVHAMRSNGPHYKSTALQSFLRNGDVLFLVFQSLYAMKSTNEIRETLVWAALTYTDFFNPAMDFLWRDMISLVPLFNLLQPVFMKEDEVMSRYTSLCKNLWLTTIISDSTLLDDPCLKRLDLYARRIRSLKFINHYDERNNLSHIFFMSHSLRPSLLPSSQRLTLLLEDWKLDIENHSFLLLSPSISVVKNSLKACGLFPSSSRFFRFFPNNFRWSSTLCPFSVLKAGTSGTLP
jgi:hypothetical protein